MTKTYILLFLLFPVFCNAQVSISGKIYDKNSNKPISDVSVYLANGTIGTRSSNDGAFILKDVKPGKYEMVVSIIGYETYHQSLAVTNSDVSIPEILLSPRVNTLQEVTIKFDKYRERNLEWFTNEFLGTSDIAKDCKVVNPEILNLSYDEDAGILRASAEDYLIIRNNALGYEVQYLLNDFTLNNKDENAKTFSYSGFIFFKEMDGTADQQRKWTEKRREVYENSLMHFLRAAISNRIDDEGFRVNRISIIPNPQRPEDNIINEKIAFYKDPKNQISGRKDSLSYWTRKSKLRPVNEKFIPSALIKDDIITPASTPGFYSLGCENDKLYIVYNKFHHFYVGGNTDVPRAGATVINFKSTSALIDSNGDLIDPNSVELSGDWADKRMAEALPFDYEPENEKVDYAVSRAVAEKFKSFSENHPAEKIYLHFDRPYYAAGDTIYFKAYVTGPERLLSSMSGVLHVDLLNAENKTDQTIKLQLRNGLAWGEFALPDSLPGGNYKVSAYTRLMLNEEKANIFSRAVPVMLVRNAHSGVKQPEKDQNDKPDIQFFPEGGDLVASVRSKVAFKAIANNGAGIDVKGVVIDDKNQEICSFTSTHLGMGYFYLEPREGKIYKAKITFANGTQTMADLPVENINGAVLSVTNDLSQLKVKISAGKSFYTKNRNKDLTLIAIEGNDVISTVFKLTGTFVSLDIDKSQFHSGVVRLTLFSPDGEPLNERLVFIKNPDSLNFNVSSNKTAYASREKVKINIIVADHTGKATNGHYSVAVTDESKVRVDEDSEHSIFTDLLLTPDLKGYVEQPGYYFKSDREDISNNLDVLMLTQGYSRFKWKPVLEYQNRKPSLPPETSLELRGAIKTPSGKPVVNGKIAFIDTKDNLALDAVTDSAGNFKFSDLNITDTAMVVLSARKGNNNTNVKVDITQPAALQPDISNIDTNSVRILPETVVLMQKIYRVEKASKVHGINLKQVTINASKVHSSSKLQHSSNLNLPGHNNYVIMGEKLINCTDLSCLYGKLPGTISREGQLYLVRTGDRLGQFKGFPPPPMAFILDGVVLPNQSYLFDMVNMNDIYSIELLKSGSYLALYGSSAPGGALVITTKRGGETSSKVFESTGLVRFPFRGFYKSREFYSPRYEHPENDNNQPDQRATVYWVPERITDKNGQASLEYYNADGPGAYRVVIEGIDENGNIGRKIYRYNVK